MAQILYCGFDHTINSIKSEFNGDTFVEGNEDAITNNLSSQIDLVLLGPLVKDPVRVTQSISSADNLVSVLIIPAPTKFNEVQKALLFAPHISKATKCLSLSTDISNEIQNELEQSIQRKKFAKLNINLDSSFPVRKEAISLEHLGNFLEQAPIGAILLNKSHNIVGINSFARKIFNAQPFQQLRSLNDLMDKNNVDNLINYLGFTNNFKAYELNLGTQYFDVTRAHVKNEKSEPMDILLITNTTEKKLEDQRMRSVLDSLPQMAWTTNYQGEVTYLTAGWYKYTGQSFSEAFGDGWKNVLHADDKEKFLESWENSINTEKPFEYEARYRRADGKYRWHLVRGIPIFSSLNKLIYWLGTCTDIDDHRLLESDLEEIIRVKTEELAKAKSELRKSE